MAFLLNMFGIFVGLVLIIISTYFSVPWSDALNGVGTSILVAAAVASYFNLKDFFLLRKKIRFFGKELVLGDAKLAYPDFMMNDDVQEILKEKNKQLLYKKPSSRYGLDKHKIDIPRVVAANDIRALLYVSPLLSVQKGRGVQMCYDRDVLDNAGCSFVSFGLSSNDCTHLYFVVDSEPLFEIVDDGRGSEYVQVQDEKFQSTKEIEYGLVLRFYPDPCNLERCWFLIAGLGPIGTTGAAYFLKTEWEKFSREVSIGQDFLVILGTPVSSEQYPKVMKVVKR